MLEKHCTSLSGILKHLDLLDGSSFTSVQLTWGLRSGAWVSLQQAGLLGGWAVAVPASPPKLG